MSNILLSDHNGREKSSLYWLVLVTQLVSEMYGVFLIYATRAEEVRFIINYLFIQYNLFYLFLSGAFLIPFFITLLFCGFPLMYMELAIGMLRNTGVEYIL